MRAPALFSQRSAPRAGKMAREFLMDPRIPQDHFVFYFGIVEFSVDAYDLLSWPVTNFPGLKVHLEGDLFIRSLNTVPCGCYESQWV